MASTDIILIDEMTEADLPSAFAIDQASFHATDLTGGKETATREQQLREELGRAWARLRVARSSANANAVVGYVLFWHVTDEIHLLNVAVLPSERRKGIGRKLVEEVIAYARTNAAVKILLEVRAGNTAAIELYRGLGFTQFNVRRAYYADGEDGIEMMAEFSDSPPK